MKHNKRLNSDNVSLSWFWQTTQKATPTHCVLGGRYVFTLKGSFMDAISKEGFFRKTDVQ